MKDGEIVRRSQGKKHPSTSRNLLQAISSTYHAANVQLCCGCLSSSPSSCSSAQAGSVGSHWLAGHLPITHLPIPSPTTRRVCPPNDPSLSTIHHPPSSVHPPSSSRRRPVVRLPVLACLLACSGSCSGSCSVPYAQLVVRWPPLGLLQSGYGSLQVLAADAGYSPWS